MARMRRCADWTAKKLPMMWTVVSSPVEAPCPSTQTKEKRMTFHPSARHRQRERQKERETERQRERGVMEAGETRFSFTTPALPLPADLRRRETGSCPGRVFTCSGSLMTDDVVRCISRTFWPPLPMIRPTCARPKQTS